MDEIQEIKRDARLQAKLDLVNGKCDKYDYLIAAFCGLASGFVDIFFVGEPQASVLGQWTDTQADKIVMKFAGMVGWNSRESKAGDVASAIGFLEKKFPVNYDQRYTPDVGGAFKMSTKNHHYKSLGHSPDIIGMFFSILDQFQGKASFLSDGQLIRIDAETQELYGGTFIAKLFCGFCNWMGHIMSDVAGSSGGRGGPGTGVGSGVPIPFFELFQLCNFGSFQVGEDRQTLATIATRAFQEGYDLRHGAAMAIPVLLCDISIRFIWAIKQHYYHGEKWSNCIPTGKHATLRCMLLVGNGALCLVDGMDAALRSGGNLLSFILHLNIIAWFRLIVLILKELSIRYSFSFEDIRQEYLRINWELEQCLECLKQVDYEAYQKEVTELANMTKALQEQGIEANTLMYSFLEKRGENLQFNNSEEFNNAMSNPDFTLKI